MVRGLDKFQQFLAGHEDKYVVIGGTACHLIFDEVGLPFRATDDVDMVICVEVLDAEFGERLQALLKAGNYQNRERSDGEKQFFRFTNPTDPAFPKMIELFSRPPATLELPNEAQYMRLAADEAAVSLSALLLDADYFDALKTGARVIDGISVLDESLLIPFKARAFLDLRARREKGESIDNKKIKKHVRDVFRLIRLLPEQPIPLSAPIKTDISRFIEVIEQENTMDPTSFGIPMSREEGLAILRHVYRV